MTAIEWLMDKLPKSIETQFSKQIEQAKQIEKQQGYSEEEAKELLKMYRNSIVEVNPVDIIYLDKWFEQFKKK